MVPKDSEISGHLPQVKWTIRSLLEGRNARGQLLAIVSKREFFANWHVNDRYEANDHVNKPTYDAWMTSAEAALSAVRLRLR
jgi:hypothetical protein